MTDGNGNLDPATAPLPIEAVVRDRYARASDRHEACLCVPSAGYEPELLHVIPSEIIEKDYGCGDPSRHVRAGETVLDLGSGGGKACYICAQKAGPAGKVIGVDFNQPMLHLARKYRAQIGDALGYHNVEFRKGRVQDLRLDLEQFEDYLAANPVTDADGYLRAQDHADRLRRASPMIVDGSVDVIVSNCVLNLVRDSDKRQLFDEMFRVLKSVGRCVVSDIVADEDVPRELREDPDLWSGCISGAMREDQFLAAFEAAGFHGMHLLARSESPWQTVRGIEFRAVTVAAYKGKQGPCLDRNQAVVYRGPWRKVVDDDGHTLERGKRMAVCDKTFRLFQREPYREQFFLIEPHASVPPDGARPFDCRGGTLRDPRQTKGAGYEPTADAGKCCGDGECG